MSDLNDLIHTNAHNAFAIGVRTEQERIIKLLEPYAEHDEMCANGCYPEDCDAPQIQYLIKKIKGEQK